MLVLTAACGSKKTSAPPPHSQVVPRVSQEDIAKCLREPVTLRAGNGYHVLAAGETLYRMSRIYDTTVDELIEINNIHDYTDIPTGTRLRVPASRSLRASYGPFPAAFRPGTVKGAEGSTGA